MATPMQQLAAQLNEDPIWISIVTNTRVGQKQRDAMMQQYAVQRGIQLPTGYHFDAGGSASFVPDRHPLRDGLITGATLLGGGTLASLALPSAAAVGAPSAASAAPAVAGGVGTAAGTGASVAASGFSLGKALLPMAINAGTGLAGAYMQSRSANAASRLSAEAANRAAEMEAKTAEQQLAFQREQAALSQQNYLDTRNFNRQVYTDQQARLAPYRQFGQGAIAQLGQPIPRG